MRTFLQPLVALILVASAAKAQDDDGRISTSGSSTDPAPVQITDQEEAVPVAPAPGAGPQEIKLAPWAEIRAWATPLILALIGGWITRETARANAEAKRIEQNPDYQPPPRRENKFFHRLGKLLTLPSVMEETKGRVEEVKQMVDAASAAQTKELQGVKDSLQFVLDEVAATMRGSMAAIIQADVHGRVVMSSRGLRHLLDVDERHGLDGHKWRAYMEPEEASEALKRFVNAAAGGAEYVQVVGLYRNDASKTPVGRWICRGEPIGKQGSERYLYRCEFRPEDDLARQFSVSCGLH